jgi:hypothetical protein
MAALSKELALIAFIACLAAVAGAGMGSFLLGCSCHPGPFRLWLMQL